MAVPFRFGRCTSPTFGSVTLDMIDLPQVQVEMGAVDGLIGGSTRSLDGTMRQDRFALKREWANVQLGGFQSLATWWPVKRLYAAGGPWMFYDQTYPNLLSADEALMQASTWTNATGTVATPRADGAVSLAIGGVVQQGPSTSPSHTLLTPVVVGQQYFAAFTVVGPGAWSVTPTVAWYTSAGTTALSTSTSGAVVKAGALSTCLCLDGSVTGYRIGFAATAPATAAYAQIRITTAVAAADISDPVFIYGPSDPGNAMTVVQINELQEVYSTNTNATLALNLSEV